MPGLNTVFCLILNFDQMIAEGGPHWLRQLAYGCGKGHIGELLGHKVPGKPAQVS